jgi:hypothetical protein
MAEKHKSKYKAPKDFEKSQKPKTRKDLKDYTHDDKNGGLNPHSTGEIQDLVPRKTDKLVIDDVKNMVPEIKHRVYQDVKTGKYSPKEAKKIFKKLQIEDTEGYLDKLENIDHGVTTSPIKEQLSRLTTEQKELALRKYLRAKIAESIRSSYLNEQPAPTEEPDTNAPTDVEPIDATATPTPTDSAPIDPTATDATATPPAPTATTTSTPPPAPVDTTSTSTPADTQAEPEKPEEMSAEEKAKIEIEKQKQAKKSFYASLEGLKSADTVIQYVEFGLEPLIKSMRSLSPDKFKMAKSAADSLLKRVAPSTLKK